MAKGAYKQRFYRAKKRVARILEQSGYTVMLLENHIFQIEAIRDKEIRKIRIILDKINEKDLEEVRNYELPLICTKEIWLRMQGEKKFIVKSIKP